MDRRKIVVPLAVLALAALGAFALIASAPPVESVAPEKSLRVVRVAEPRAEDVRLRVRSQGTVAPRSESDLVPEVSGPVVWVSPVLVSGGFFAHDEPLLRIDPRDYEASVARARADVARLESEFEHAQSELGRQEGLARKKANSPSQLSNARRASRVAGASLEAARVTLEQAERDLARTEIRAPYEGRVREESVDVGQFVSRGAPVARLYATDFAEIRLPLADHQLAYIDLPSGRHATEDQPGPEVRLRARFAGVDQQWIGRIVRTEGEIDARSRMVHVVARVEDPYGTLNEAGAADRAPLAVGLFVQAEIDGPLAENVLVVPRSAMRDGERILVVDAQDRLYARAADVLRIDRDDVLLRAELSPGERICLSPLQVVIDGMQVRPIDESGDQAGGEDGDAGEADS
jgi:RND family efflux transporter MFP subunit